MPTQKLQVERAINVIPSDTINLPDPAKKILNSTATTTTANKLVDSTKDFTTNGTAIGNIIYNTSTSLVATVTGIDSATTLSISADIMLDTNAYVLYASAASSALFFIGVAGDLKVTTYGGEEVLFTAHPAGYAPLNVKRIWSTTTTATNIIALW